MALSLNTKIRKCGNAVMIKVGIKFVFSIFGLGVIINNKCHLLSVTRNTIHLKKSIKEITMKKTIYATIMAGILTLSFNAHAGSGAGGIIQVINRTGGDLLVTWSGIGCAEWTFDTMGAVCERSTIPSNQSQTYSYNWGTTETWLNIGLTPPAEYIGNGVHPCAPSAIQYHGLARKCIADHHTVSTNANEVNTCTVTQNENNTYTTSCN